MCAEYRDAVIGENSQVSRIVTNARRRVHVKIVRRRLDLWPPRIGQADEVGPGRPQVEPLQSHRGAYPD